MKGAEQQWGGGAFKVGRPAKRKNSRGQTTWQGTTATESDRLSRERARALLPPRASSPPSTFRTISMRCQVVKRRIGPPRTTAFFILQFFFEGVEGEASPPPTSSCQWSVWNSGRRESHPCRKQSGPQSTSLHHCWMRPPDVPDVSFHVLIGLFIKSRLFHSNSPHLTSRCQGELSAAVCLKK